MLLTPCFRNTFIKLHQRIACCGLIPVCFLPPYFKGTKGLTVSKLIFFVVHTGRNLHRCKCDANNMANIEHLPAFKFTACLHQQVGPVVSKSSIVQSSSPVQYTPCLFCCCCCFLCVFFSESKTYILSHTIHQSRHLLF